MNGAYNLGLTTICTKMWCCDDIKQLKCSGLWSNGSQCIKYNNALSKHSKYVACNKEEYGDVDVSNKSSGKW